MFEGEALGLGAMYETKSIRVPKPFKVRYSPHMFHCYQLASFLLVVYVNDIVLTN